VTVLETLAEVERKKLAKGGNFAVVEKAHAHYLSSPFI
jgi:hypothetical protein